MDWWKVLIETINVSYATILKMVYIVIPLLIAIECLKDMGWLEKISSRFQGVTKFFKLPGESALGIIVGFSAGLILGSGVIMQITEDVKMSKLQINIMFIFIGICHAIIEETILFTAIGASGIIILLSRTLTALVVTLIYIRVETWIVGIKGEQGHSIKSGE